MSTLGRKCYNIGYGNVASFLGGFCFVFISLYLFVCLFVSGRFFPYIS